MNDSDLSSMARLTGCSEGSFLFTYLGLPTGSNMNLISSWSTIIDRFKSKLSSWKANLLSIGGRLTLIKSSALEPSFFWRSDGSSKKLAWINSSQVLASLERGGLGIGSLKSFNFALLLKWCWRLVSNPNALWVSIIKAIHGGDVGLGTSRCFTNGVWAAIIGLINTLHSNGILPKETLQHRVGNETQIKFWKDSWIGEEPLNICYNRLFRLDLHEDCYIHDRWSPNGWIWNWRRLVENGRIGAIFSSMLAEL
ncbi:hypothetical protein Tco_1005606 [Tanacetum coccineum]|uniref:Uncharacterized protein n=1 Tax=Tanacetum coccineum TaxID=301880 RepID=A0ABQ5FGL0_9ASTR